MQVWSGPVRSGPRRVQGGLAGERSQPLTHVRRRRLRVGFTSGGGAVPHSPPPAHWFHLSCSHTLSLARAHIRRPPHTHTHTSTHTYVEASVVHISLLSLLAFTTVLRPLYHVKKNGRDKVGSPVASIHFGRAGWTLNRGKFFLFLRARAGRIGLCVCERQRENNFFPCSSFEVEFVLKVVYVHLQVSCDAVGGGWKLSRVLRALV